MKSAFAVHKESNGKKPGQAFKIRLKPPGKVTKAKKKNSKKVAKKAVETKKKTENKTKAKKTDKDAASITPKPTSLTSKPTSPKSKPTSPRSKPTTPKSKPTTPKSKPSTPKSKLITPKSKLTTPKPKPTSPKSKPTSPKSKSTTPKSGPRSPKSKPASSNKDGDKAVTQKAKKTPSKKMVKSKKSPEPKKTVTPAKKFPSPPSQKSSSTPESIKTPNRRVPSSTKKGRSVNKSKENASKKPKSAIEKEKVQAKKTPRKKSLSDTPRKTPAKKKKGKEAKKASEKSATKSPRAASVRVTGTDEKSLELTPGSEKRATEAATRNTMLLQITPLKSGDQRKRRSTTTVGPPKSAKKLKIKVTPKKQGTTPSPVKAASNNLPVRKQSPSIVNFGSPPNGLLGGNGPSTLSDSVKESALLFEWLISPVNPSNFFDNLWEKKPLLVRRHKPEYYQGLFSTAEFNNLLQENDVQFGSHIDVTTYTDGKRETHNPEGRAHAPVVWDYFNSGCSVRLLNPQTYSTKIWKLLDTLRENFGSFCGANIYLTPAGTQGFAPHYDDIEAFILQLEGRKQWKLYSPRNDHEVLPRISSDNFTDGDLGPPILDTVLEEGDILYFPRGYIHQASPPSDAHSLHLTVSMCQKNTWGDLMSRLVTETLQSAMEEDLEFRLSLPRDYLNYMGVINSDKLDDKRAKFRARLRDLFGKMATYAPLDVAVDQMGKDLIHASLPPVLTEDEKACMIYSTKVRFEDSGFVSDSSELTEETEIQLIRKGVLRLVTEDEEIRVYHCMENLRVYHGKPAQYFVIPPQSAPGVEFLFQQYPKYVQIQDLPLEGELRGKEVELATVLYEKGLIRTRHPLNSDSSTPS